MPDVIHLLPESIANQIAAGEVIQRPSSVVKELLENAVDAGGTEIKLIIKDSGKTLIQVVDNGMGMSEIDARMCFERHATSKIKKSEDLFSIKTKGFRGEAMASVAAVAQVELKTRQHSESIGRRIVIAGSEINKQEAHPSPAGSSFAVKNLFYNVPARRKFLKSDPVELKHILEEFLRVALAHPDIFFSCFHNDNNLYHLPKANLRQRIVATLGKTLNEKLIPVKEESDFISIQGFIGKPDAAKRAKGEQYFFVNQRFIKNNYLAHAVFSAYESLIPDKHYPVYFLYLQVQAEKLDINIHPSKQEVKFEEERLIYNYVKLSAKHALGEYALTPTIDFDQLENFGFTRAGLPDFSFDHSKIAGNQRGKASGKEIENWESMYSGLQTAIENRDQEQPMTVPSSWDEKEDELELQKERKIPFQLHGSYIISQIKSGLVFIDQQAAHERIIYEKVKRTLKSTEKTIQQELFPTVIELDPSNAEILEKVLESLNKLGFLIEDFGKNSFIMKGVPAGMSHRENMKETIEEFLDKYVSNLEFQLGIDDNVARSIASTTGIKKGKLLHQEEMADLIDKLFACEDPFTSPSGRRSFITMELTEIQKKFGN